MSSKPDKYTPKHRAPSAATVAKDAPKKVLRSTLLFSSVAVAATAGVVGTGVASTPLDVSSATGKVDDAVPSLAPAAAEADTEIEERSAPVSRSDPPRRRRSRQGGGAVAGGRSGRDPHRGPERAGPALDRPGAARRVRVLLRPVRLPGLALWTKESNWTVNADNPTSSAYGIPQALPGSKMASAGADWATNPATQIRWGLGYIQDRYGSPCSAWAHSQANNWY